MFSIFYRLFFAICFSFSGINTSLTTSVVPDRTPIFANILQSIDAAKSDEHLYNVTLQFLKVLCQCLNENFKGGNSFDRTSNVLIWNDENSLYKKVNNSTCIQLQQQISQKIDWIDLNEARYKQENDRRQTYFTDQSNNSFSYDVEEILYETLIDSKDIHNYSIHKYSLLRRKTFLENPTHNVIVIFTFQSKDNDQKNIHLDESDIKKLIYINSSIAIDVIDTKYEKSFEENANTKSDSISLCNLYSIYNFLALHHKNNKTHVFKVFRKYQSVKIYLDVITDHVHDDLTTVCCANGSLASSCKERISIQNANLEKYALKVGAFRNTLHKIKLLVKFYTENSELNASELDINECDKMKNDENILQNDDLIHEFFPKQETNNTHIKKEKNGQIWKSYNSAYGSIQNRHKRKKLSKRHSTEVVSLAPIPNVSYMNKIDNNITSLFRSTVSIITTEEKSSQSKEFTKPIVLESNPMLNSDKIIDITSNHRAKITFPDTALPTSNFNGMSSNDTSSPLANNTLNQRGFTTPILRNDYEENNQTNFADANSNFTIKLSLTQNNFSIGPSLSFEKHVVTLKTNENDVSKDFSNFENPKIPITTQHILSDTRHSPKSGYDSQEKYLSNLIDQSTSNNDSFTGTATTIGSFEKKQTHNLPLISQTEIYVSRSTPDYLSSRQSVRITTFSDFSLRKFGKNLKEEYFSNGQNLSLSEMSTPTQVYLTNEHKFLLPTSSIDLQHNNQTPASLQFRGSNDLSSRNVSPSTQNNLSARFNETTLKMYMQGKYHTNFKDLSRQPAYDVTKNDLTSRKSLRGNYDTSKTPNSQTNKDNHINSPNISTSTQSIFKNSLGPANTDNFQYNEAISLKNVSNNFTLSTISQYNISNGQRLVTTTSDKNIQENNSELNYISNQRFSSTKSSGNQNTTTFQQLPSTQNNLRARLNETTSKNYMQEKYQTNLKGISKDFSSQPAYSVTKNYLSSRQSLTLAYFNNSDSFRGNYDTYKTDNSQPNKFNHKKSLNISTSTQSMFQNSQRAAIRDNFKYNEDISLKTVKNYLSPTTITHGLYTTTSNGQSLDTRMSDKNVQEYKTELNYILNRRFRSTQSSNNQNTTTSKSGEEFQILSSSLYLTDQPVSISETFKNIQDNSTVQDNFRIQTNLITTTPIQSSQQSLITTIKGSKKKSTKESRTAINNFTGQPILNLATPYHKFHEKVTLPKIHYHPSLKTTVIRDNWQESIQVRFKGEKTHAHATHHQPTQSYFSKGHNYFSSTTFRYNNISLQMNGENNNDFKTSTSSTYKGNKSFPLRKTQQLTGLTIKNKDNNNSDLLWNNKIPNLPPDSTYDMMTSSNDLQYSHQTYVPASLQLRGSNDFSSLNVSPSTQNNLRARLNETKLKNYKQEKYQTNLKDKSKGFSRQPAYSVTKTYLTSRQSLKLASFNDSFRGNYGTYKAANSQSNKYNHKKSVNISTSTQSMFKNSQSPDIRENYEYNEDDALKNFKNELTTSTITQYVSNDQSLSTTTSDKNIQEHNTELNYILNRRFISTNSSNHQNTTTTVSRDEFQIHSTALYLTHQPVSISETFKNIQDKRTIQDNFRIKEILVTTTPTQSSQQSLITTIKGSKKKSTQESRTAINNFTGQQILNLATPYHKFHEKVTIQNTHYHPSLTTPVIRENFQENNQVRFKGEKTHAHATHHQPTQSYFSKGNKFSSTTFRYDNILLQMNGENYNDSSTSAPSTYERNKSFLIRETQQLTGLTIKNYDKNNSDLLWKNKIPNLPLDSTYENYMKNTQAYFSNANKFKLTTSSNDLQHSDQTYVPASLQFRESNELSIRNVSPSTQNNSRARFNETILKMYMPGKYQTNLKDLSRQPAYDVTKNDLTSRQSLRGSYDTYKTPYSQTNKNNNIKSLNMSISTQSMLKNSQSPSIRDNYEYNEDDALKNVKNDLTPSTITHNNNTTNGQSLDTTTHKNLSDKNIQENNTELNFILNRSVKRSDHQNTTTAVSRVEFKKLSTSLYLTDKPILITVRLKKIKDKNTVQDDIRIQEILITTTPKNILQENSTTLIQSSQQSLITTIKGSKKKSTQDNGTAINNFTVQQILTLATPYNKFKEKETVHKTHYHPSLTTPVIRDNWQESNQVRFKGEKTHAHATHHQPTQSYFSKGHNFSSTTFRYDNILVQMNVENNNEFATSAPSSYKGNKKLLRKTQKSTGLTINNNAKHNSDPLWKNKIPNLPPDSTYNIYIKNATDLRKVKYKENTLTTAESDIIINTKKPQLLVTQFNISQQNVAKFKNVSTNYFDNTTSTSKVSPKWSDIQFQEKAFISTIVPSLLKTVLNKDLANRSVHKSNIAVPKNSSAYNVNLKNSSKNNQTLILQDNLQYMISNNITNKTLRIFPTDMETNIEMNVSKSKKMPLGIFNTYITSAVDYTHIEDTIIQKSKNLKFANNLILAKTISPNILNEYLKPTKILSKNYFKSIKEKGRIDETKDAFADLASNTISPLWTVTKSLNRLPKLKKATKNSSTYVTIKTYYPDNIGYNSQMFTTTALFLTPKSSSSIPVIRIGNQKEVTLYSDARGITNYTMGYNGSNHLSSSKQTTSMIKNNIEGITKSSPRPFEYNQIDKITTYNLKSAVTEYNVNKSKSVATLRRQKDYSTILGNIRKLENSSVKAVTSAIFTPYRNNLNRTRMLNLSYTTTKIPGKLTYIMNRNSYTAITTPMAYHYANNKGPPTSKINLGNVTRKIYKEIQVKDKKNIKNEIKMLIATRPLTNNVTTDDSILSDSNMNYELHSGKQLNSTNKFVFLKIDKSTTVSDLKSKNFTIQSPTSRDWNYSSSPSVQEIDTTTLKSIKSEPHQGQLNITQSVILHNRFRHGKTKNNRTITASSSNSLKQWTTVLPLTEQNIKLWSVKTLSPKLLTDVQNGLLLLNHSYSHHTTQPAQNYAEKATTIAIKSLNSEFTNVIKPSIALFTTQVSKEIQTGQNILRGVIENDRYVTFNNTFPTTNVIDHNKFTVHQNYIKKTTEMSIFSKYRKQNDVRFAKKDNYFTTDLRSKTAKYSDAIRKTKKSMNLKSENITSKKILYNKTPLDITTPLLPKRIINVQNTTTILSSILKVSNGGTAEYNNSNTLNYNTDNVSLLSKQFNKNLLKYNVNPTRIYNDLIKKSIRITSPVNIIELKVSMPTEVVVTSQRKSERSEIKEIELDIDQNLTKTKDSPVKTPTVTFLKTTNFIKPIKQNNTAFTRQYLFHNRYTMGLDAENLNLLGTTTLKAENTKTFDDHLSILKHHFEFDNITSIENKTLNTLLLGRYKIIRTSTTSYENKATQAFHLQNRSTSPSQNIRKKQNVTNSNKPQTKYCSDVYKAVYLQNIYLNIPILVANHNDINVCNFSYNIVDNTHSNFTTKQLNFSHIIPKNKLSDYLKNISTLISSKTIDRTYSSEKDTQDVFKEAFEFKQINPKTEVILTETAWPMTTENKNFSYLKTNPNRNLNLLPTEGKFSNIATKIKLSAIKPAKVSLDTDFTTALYSSTTKTLTTSSFFNVVKAITPPLKVKKIRYNTYKPKSEEDFDTTILKFNKNKFSTINTVQKAVTKSDYRLLSSTTYKEKKTSNKKNKHLNHLKNSGVPKGPVKDMRKIIVHTKSVIDPLAKTNLYPVQRIPSTSQRKVMKRIRLMHKNKELLAMDTNDFFSRRHNDVPESRGKSHGILRKGFFTPKPKEYIIRPTFKMIDKPQSFRPKPIIIESDSFYKNHFPRNRGKSLSLLEQVDYFRDTIKEPQTVLERPAYLPPHTKPKFLRDRIDSIRNYVHNSDYLRASDSAGEIDRYAVFREPEFNFRRHETTTTIRTTVKYTRRKPRTIFFLSPTVPYNRYF